MPHDASAWLRRAPRAPWLHKRGFRLRPQWKKAAWRFLLISAHLCHILGLPWAVSGRSYAAWRLRRPVSGASPDRLGAPSLGPCSAVLGLSWEHIRSSWGPLDPSWGPVGSLSGLLWAILEASWAVGRSYRSKRRESENHEKLREHKIIFASGGLPGDISEASWGVMRASSAVLRRVFVVLGQSWAVLDTY